jgi:hypothetical protein
LAARHPVQAADHGQVLEAGEVLVDRRVLAGEADPLAQLGRVVDDVEPGDARGSRVGEQKCGQDPHDRGLACAIRTEQAEDGPAAHVEVDAVEGPDLAVCLRQATDADRELVV